MADVELLPLPEWHGDFMTESEFEEAATAYARACVEANLAPLQAENERLRAEVERLTFDMSCLQQQYDERTAYMIVHRGSALACSDSVRAAYSDEHERAERLAEALRKLSADLRTLAGGETPDGDGVPVNVMLWAEKRLAAIAAANGGNDASA